MLVPLLSRTCAHIIRMWFEYTRCCCPVCWVHVRFVCLCTSDICVHKHFEYVGELSSYIWKKKKTENVSPLCSFFFSVSLSPWFYWYFCVWYLWNSEFERHMHEVHLCGMCAWMWLCVQLFALNFCFVSRPIKLSPSTSTKLDWGTRIKLIGCVLSDRDIDHNSKVLNAFYLFIESIHFACLKHIYTHNRLWYSTLFFFYFFNRSLSGSNVLYNFESYIYVCS